MDGHAGGGEERVPVRIGELAARSGVSERSLRYYERQGLLAPCRSAAGQRLFDVDDVDTVVQIQELYAAGFCSKGVREVLPLLAAPGPASAADLREIVRAAEARLEHEKRTIDQELEVLRALAARVPLAPDTRVRGDDRRHGDEPAPPAPPDHRDRRLR